MMQPLPSLSRPSGEEWAEARRCFEGAVSAHRAAEASRIVSTVVDTDTDTAASEGSVQVPEDPMGVWVTVARRSAPSFVRANAWLLSAWAMWCVRKEEPGVLILGCLGFGVLGLGAIYPLIKWVVGLALSPFAG